VIVHHIKVNQIGASGFNIADFFAQAGKIGDKMRGAIRKVRELLMVKVDSR
jgi:hypothetical protein